MIGDADVIRRRRFKVHHGPCVSQFRGKIFTICPPGLCHLVRSFVERRGHFVGHALTRITTFNLCHARGRINISDGNAVIQGRRMGARCHDANGTAIPLHNVALAGNPGSWLQAHQCPSQALSLSAINEARPTKSPLSIDYPPEASLQWIQRLANFVTVERKLHLRARGPGAETTGLMP